LFLKWRGNVTALLSLGACRQSCALAYMPVVDGRKPVSKLERDALQLGAEQ
jgi:hypothetical protein